MSKDKKQIAINTHLWLPICLFGVFVLIAVFSLNEQEIGIAIGLFAVVALVAWLISPGATLSAEYLESMGITAKAEAVCDFLMMFVYIMLGGTIAAVIYSAVAKLFN